MFGDHQDVFIIGGYAKACSLVVPPRVSLLWLFVFHVLCCYCLLGFASIL
jgi:hypothetical protein